MLYEQQIHDEVECDILQWFKDSYMLRECRL